MSNGISSDSTLKTHRDGHVNNTRVHSHDGRLKVSRRSIEFEKKIKIEMNPTAECPKLPEI